MRIIFILLFSFLLTLLMYFTVGPFDNFSNSVFISSSIIQIISICIIFSNEKKPYSLNSMFYLFSFFFFGIAPLLQFYKGSSFFGARKITENEYFIMNILIIIILLLYQFFYNYFYKKNLKQKSINTVLKLEIDNKFKSFQSILLILLALMSFLIVYKAHNNSILSMLIRGSEYSEIRELSTTELLIIGNFFRPISMMCLLYFISSQSKNYFVLIILFILALITCSPTGMARFAAAAMYIPLMLLIFPFMRKKNVFPIVFILGLLIIFPFLNNFRNFSGDKLNFGFNFDMFLQGHFDSYQNFALIVVDNIITWGRQLLGVILFWLPRSIWPDKPIGSGAFIAEEQGFIFSNVSCNYFAEGYINFGFIGIFFFIIILSFVTARLDKMHWTVSVHNKNNYFNVIYYVLIGMFFFILRGDLMSSFAFTIGFLFAIWLVNKVVRIGSDRN